MPEETERHLHLGQPEATMNGYCAPRIDNNKIHNYDDEDRWTIETYDRRSETLLEALGAQRVKSHHDGLIYDVDARQLIEYVAAYHHIVVDFPKRRRMKLSPERREALRQRMLRINAERDAP